MKKALIRVLMIVLSLTILCALAAAESGKVQKTSTAVQASGTLGDNLTWELDDAGTLTISGNGEMKSSDMWIRSKAVVRLVVKPGVTSIGEKNFYGCTALKEVSLPEGLTRIEDAAFIMNSSLTGIDIPASVTYIGDSAFSLCDSMTRLTVASGNTHYSAKDNVLFNKDGTELILCANGRSGRYEVPGTVTSLHYRAFGGCINLTEVVIPDSVTEIGNLLFEDCRSLASVRLPQGMNTIPRYMFDNCSGLQSIQVPDSVHEISDFAFSGCSSLQSISLPYHVWKIGEFAFDECRSLTTFVLPENLEVLGSCAFDECEGLEEITIPYYVRSVGSGPFIKCSNLKNIYVHAKNKRYRSENGVLFSIDSSGNSTLHSFPGARSGEYAIPDGTERIGYYAFAYTGVTNVIIPSSVKSIGPCAFDALPNLKTIHIPETVEDISSSAFAGTDCIIDVVPGSPAHTFVTEQNLPHTVNGVTEEAVTGTADGFSYMVKADGNATITECSLTGDIVIPSVISGYPVNSLQSELFYGISGITSVYIPASVTYFGIDKNDNDWDYVFSYCYDLKSIEVDPANTAFCSEGGVLYDKNKTRLIQYPCNRPGESFHLPESTTLVCCTSFARARQLWHLYLTSKNVDWMGYAFYGDDNLTVHYRTGGSSESRYEINHSFCSFVTYDPNGPHEHAVVKEATVEPTCLKEGHKGGTHCAECGDVLTAPTVIPALGHDWSDPSYEWTSDYASVTASHICSRDEVEETETVQSTSVTTPATTESEGSIVYTAVFENPAFSAQTHTELLPKLNPDPDTPETVFTVTVTVSDQKAGTAYATPASGTAGTVITLDAEANTGYLFKKWKVVSGGVRVKNNQFTLGTANVEVQAVFKKMKGSVSSGGLKYKLNHKKKTAVVTGAVKKTAAKITIPKTVKANGLTYTVTEIGKEAFKGLKKLTEVTIGANVRKIGNDAFRSCAKLKTINIKTKHLTTASTVGSNAFKGIYSKATFKCPKGMAKTYKKILKKKGAPKKAVFK